MGLSTIPYEGLIPRWSNKWQTSVTNCSRSYKKSVAREFRCYEAYFLESVMYNWTCQQTIPPVCITKEPQQDCCCYCDSGFPVRTLGSLEEVRRGHLPGMSAWMKAGACFAGEWTSTAVIQWALATCRISSLERRSWRNRQQKVLQLHHCQDQKEAAWMPWDRSPNCLWIPPALPVARHEDAQGGHLWIMEKSLHEQQQVKNRTKEHNGTKIITKKGSGLHWQKYIHSSHLVLMFATRLGHKMGQFY